MFIWLALFLLDVAMRRVVLDFRAIARKVAFVLRYGKTELKADKTLERLKARRQKLRDQLEARKAASVASKRYRASEEFEGELPVADTKRPVRPQPEKKPAEEAPAKPAAAEGSEHIQRLLRAKRKAADPEAKEETEN